MLGFGAIAETALAETPESSISPEVTGWQAASFGTPIVYWPVAGWNAAAFGSPQFLQAQGWKAAAFGTPQFLAVSGWAAGTFGVPHLAVTFDVHSFRAARFGTPVLPVYVRPRVSGWNAAKFGRPVCIGLSPRGFADHQRVRFRVGGWSAASFGTPTM